MVHVHSQHYIISKTFQYIIVEVPQLTDDDARIAAERQVEELNENMEAQARHIENLNRCIHKPQALLDMTGQRINEQDEQERRQSQTIADLTTQTENDAKTDTICEEEEEIAHVPNNIITLMSTQQQRTDDQIVDLPISKTQTEAVHFSNSAPQARVQQQNCGADRRRADPQVTRRVGYTPTNHSTGASFVMKNDAGRNGARPKDHPTRKRPAAHCRTGRGRARPCGASGHGMETQSDREDHRVDQNQEPGKDHSSAVDLARKKFKQLRNVFMRKLILIASDALDSIRRESITDPSRIEAQPNLFINIVPDETNSTLTIEDSGIGMTKNELAELSPTKFAPGPGAKAFHETVIAGGDISMIGRIGIGFYSAFLVSDKVIVVSKHNDDDQYICEFDGRALFTLQRDTEMAHGEIKRGTKVICYIGRHQTELLSEHPLKDLIKQHAELTAYPIKLHVVRIQRK